MRLAFVAQFNRHEKLFPQKVLRFQISNTNFKGPIGTAN